MFGPRITTVFKSRWRALVWSMGILAMAYCTVPAVDPASQQQAEMHLAASKSAWAY